jgi:uncharacterized protein (TIGR02246 family)
MPQNRVGIEEDVRMAIDAQVTSTIQKLGQDFAEAFKRGDFAAMSALFAEDAVLLPPGAESVAGRSNIQLFWGRNRRIRELRFEPTNVKALGPDTVRETGALRISVGGAGPQLREVIGKYASIWQKVSGEWKLEFCMWNRNGGAQAGRGGGRGARLGRQQGGQGGGRWQGRGQGGGRRGQRGGAGGGPAPFVPRIDD